MIKFLIFVFLSTLSAEEVVFLRDLQVNYDFAQLEKEIEIVAAYYMPRHGVKENWTLIPLRNATGTKTHQGIELYHTLRRGKMRPCQNTEYLDLLPYTCSILEDIAEKFEAEVGLVRLSKVPSLKEISPHRDGKEFDIYKGSVYRFHIPIVTGENVIFNMEENHYQMERGKLYYANVAKIHSVINNGPTDRIHLLIDLFATPQLRERILACPELSPKS